MRKSKALIFLSVLTNLAGCSDGTTSLERKYNLTCFGSDTAYCQDMRIDLEIAKLDTEFELIQRNKNDFIRKYGVEGFEKSENIYKQTREELDSFRPNWFLKKIVPDAVVDRHGNL